MEFTPFGFGNNASARAVRKMTLAKDQGSIKILKNEIVFLFLWAHILAVKQDMNIQCPL